MPKIPEDFLDDDHPDPIVPRLRPEDIRVQRLLPRDLALLQQHAPKATLGGQSAIYIDREKREAQKREDNYIGQMVTLAGHLWFYGTDSLYAQDRERQNQHPSEGDGGSDVGADSNIDFKGSLMRRKPDPMTYYLLVRPKEFYEDWVYYLGLVRPIGDGSYSPDVLLLGWATTDMLRHRLTRAERFGGEPGEKTYALPATGLHPMPPHRFRLRRALVKTEG